MSYLLTLSDTVCLPVSDVASLPHAAAPTRCQVVYGHLDDPEGQDIKRGVSYLKLRPGESFNGKRREKGGLGGGVLRVGRAG